MGVMTNTVGAVSFLRRELDVIGIVANPAKVMLLSPIGCTRRWRIFRFWIKLTSASLKK